MSGNRSTIQAPEASIKQSLAVVFSVASRESSHQDLVVPKSTLEPMQDTSIEPNNQKEEVMASTLSISATTPRMNDQNSTVEVDQAVLADPTNHPRENVNHIPDANISDISLANVQHTSLDSPRQEPPLMADERDTLIGTTDPEDPTADVAEAVPSPTEEEQHRHRLLGFIEQAHAHGHRGAVMMFIRMLYPDLNPSLPEEPALDLTGRRPAQYIFSPTSPYGYMIFEQGIYFVPGLVTPFPAEDLDWPQPEHHLPLNDRFRKLKKQKKKKRKQRSYNCKLM